MIKKFCFLLALFQLITQLSYAQIKWKFKPYYSLGYASNILLSPSILANPGIDTIGKHAIYKRDLFNKIGLTNRFELGNSKGGIFGVNTSLQSMNYATVDDIDTYIIKNSIDYKFKIDTDFTFIPRAGIEKTRKLTIDILTDDGVNTYDYWYFFGGSEAYYRVNKKLRLGADLESGWKSYKTMPSGRNFTHMQYLLSFEAEYWMNKINFLNVGYAFKRYDFASLTSEFIPNALIDWSYNSVFALIKYKIDDDHYVSYTIELERKSDFNKSDFSFSQWNNKLVWDWYFNKIGIYGDLQANFRNYKRRTAYTEADSDLDELLLKYNYYTANIKLKYNWSSSSTLYLGYSREIRETNSTRLERLYRRPFEFFGFSVGWTYAFNKEIAKAIPTNKL
jgi:hypothetical protein